MPAITDFNTDSIKAQTQTSYALRSGNKNRILRQSELQTESNTQKQNDQRKSAERPRTLSFSKDNRTSSQTKLKFEAAKNGRESSAKIASQ